MFEMNIKGVEFYNEELEEFITTEDKTLRLEHSLMAISKWEREYCKPFLTEEVRNTEEIKYYIKCACTHEVSDKTLMCISQENVDDFKKYMDRPMSAVSFKKEKETPSEIISTAETIYSQMFALNIPMECQKWHFNSLVSLIRYCAEKNSPGKKETREEAAARHRRINQEARAKYYKK